MKNNKLLSIIVGMAFSVFAISQATLPTSSDFSGASLPTGWSANAENYYPSSGNPAPAFRLDATGEYLEIHVASTPGEVTFDIAGNQFGTGTFEVQESVDGGTFTTVQVYNNTNIDVNGAYQGKTLNLDPASRYIRFIYVLKSGGNIGLDNVVINPGVVTSQQMEVSVDGGVISNNSTHVVTADVGNTGVLPFVIANTGTADALEVASIVISGADAAEFELSNAPTFPLNIAAASSENIGIDFTPTSAGTKNATVTITSDDLDFSSFSFDVIGYGDGFATEPTSQPTALSFSGVKTYTFDVDYTASGADGYLVLRKIGTPVTEIPADGTVYGPGDVIGDAKVVIVTSNSSFTPNDIVAGTDYHFAVFAYNGLGQGVNYLEVSPLTGNQTTPANMIPTANYTGIDVSNTTLINDIYGVIAPHFQQYYSNYASLMVDGFYGRDTINGQKVVTGQYTGIDYIYDYPFAFASAGMSREHTFPTSWFPLSDVDANYHSDYHNLLLVNQNDANAIRLNYPLGEVVSDIIQTQGGATFGKNAAGEWVYEPTDETKGMAARAMFYMAVRYTEGATNWGFPAVISTSVNYGQDQDLLKQWNIDFPPTNLEIARNDYIETLQNNRNPFIDHPEYACYIDFVNMTYLANGCTSSLTQEKLSNNVSVYPNPATNIVYVRSGEEIKELKVVDLSGRVLNSYSNLNNSTEINVNNFPSGTYLIEISTNTSHFVNKVIVQ
ncbi:MAG: endonuclease [Brumimicrobium sp.]